MVLLLQSSISNTTKLICRKFIYKKRIFGDGGGHVMDCISKRNYHDLSYEQSGDPRHVLEYTFTNTTNNNDNNLITVEMLGAPWNPADAMMVAGRYPNPFTSSQKQIVNTIRQSSIKSYRTVPGSEGIGRVIHSNTDTFQIGDYVVPAISGLGTYRSTISIPKDVINNNDDDDILLSLFVKINRGQELWDKCNMNCCPLFQLGGTALRMLLDFQKHLQPGDVIIQNAGNSGVGLMISQLAHIHKLQSISIVRKGNNRTITELHTLVDYLKQIGKNTLVWSEEDILLESSASQKAIIQEYKDIIQQELGETSSSSVKLALNAVGGPSAQALMQLLDIGGTMVTYGGMSKKPVIVPTTQLIFHDIHVVGYWHSRWMAQISTVQEREKLMNDLVDYVLNDQLICPEVQVFPLSQLKESLDYEIEQSNEPIRKKIVFDCRK